MATRMLRRGLPRVPGGEPWPPGDITVDVEGGGADVPADRSPAAAEPAAEQAAEPAVGAAEPADAAPAPALADGVQRASSASPVQAAPMRRGLPRVPGGEPWPPAGTAASGGEQVSSHTTSASASSLDGRVESTPTASPAVEAAPVVVPREEAAPAANTPANTASNTAATAGPAGSVRRGLPRVAGGEPWPPAGTVPAATVVSDATPLDAPASDTAVDPASDTAVAPTITTPATAAVAPDAAVATARTTTALGDPSVPLPAPRTVWNGRAPRHITAGAPASGRPRPTWTQAIVGLFGAAALGILAAAAVAFVRALLSFPFMQDFLAAFPGEYAPAVAVEPGFAPWIGWQHFFNVFLMVLIIRSGLRIRSEKRPTAFWTPRGDPKGKVSLTVWFHQALDVLWIVNGVIFVVLLFTTGHWARIVPTSWEVFPNALSAALQYISFDWPHENGWNNYNSLQQLAYFTTVFIAAPLAVATGFRMSGMWPKKAERLSKAYPIEWARALHFPVMLYFVAFIIAHVALVFLTGFLRNLNHMYASSDAVGWTGFWVFVASLGVIAVGWVAARPLVIAPIARLFGSVSGR